MAAAGVATGAVIAVAEAGGNTRVQIRTLLHTAPVERGAAAQRGVIYSGNHFLRAARTGLRSADGHRASSHHHVVHASASRNEPRFLTASSAQGVLIRPLLNAAPLERTALVQRGVINSGTNFMHNTWMGLRSADDHRTTSHSHVVHASASQNEPRFLPASSAQAIPRKGQMKQRCSSSSDDNKPDEPRPQARRKILALLIKLKVNIGLLLLIAVSLWIGFLAFKEHPTATRIVDVCDKGHKVYNITSKAFLIIAALLKGDDK